MTDWKFGDDETEYRIEYQIQRRRPENEDFTEIGFGSSDGWGNVDAALYAMSSDVENRQWETRPGMPEPGSIGKGDDD
jgi:hypothetical protein